MILMRGNRVAVEKLKKQSKKEDFLHIPEIEHFLGIIKFLGDAAPNDLKLGQKVYFGDKIQNIKIDGLDLSVMDADNIVAIVNEDKKETNL